MVARVRSRTAGALCAAAIFMAPQFVDVHARQAGDSRPPMKPAALSPILDKYCVTCHNDRLKTGGVTFQGIDVADISANGELLERAVRKLLVGAMPPQGAARPESSTYRAFAASLESALDRAA